MERGSTANILATVGPFGQTMPHGRNPLRCATVINRQGGKPLYLQLADALRDRITSHEFGPGDQLPAEDDLAHHYGVGKDTLRDAFAVLRNQGLIVTRRGYRAVVVEPVETETLTLEPGQRVSARMPTPEERERLELPDGVPVLLVLNPDGSGDIYPGNQVIAEAPDR